MNLYVIRTLRDVCLYRETEVDPGEDGIAYRIITAPTRGQARAEFCRVFKLDFTEPLRVVKLHGDFDTDAGGPELWVQAGVQMYEMSESQEWDQWRGMVGGDWPPIETAEEVPA